jgi:hypothetical protein
MAAVNVTAWFTVDPGPVGGDGNDDVNITEVACTLTLWTSAPALEDDVGEELPMKFESP